MLTLLGSLLGFLSSALPELIKMRQDIKERAHVLDLLDRQMASKERQGATPINQGIVSPTTPSAPTTSASASASIPSSSRADPDPGQGGNPPQKASTPSTSAPTASTSVPGCSRADYDPAPSSGSSQTASSTSRADPDPAKSSASPTATASSTTSVRATEGQLSEAGSDDMDAILVRSKSEPESLYIVELLRASVRPVITYGFFALFIAVKVVAIVQYYEQGASASDMLLAHVWDEETQALFAAIISFWFGSRALVKIRSSASAAASR